jgi:hypothetical protein
MFRHFDVGSRPYRTMHGLRIVVIAVAVLGACHREPGLTTPREVPRPAIAVGACATPGRDGVMGATPRVDRADRDLNGDGVAEPITVDRSLCTAEGNCYWNVFVLAPGGSPECPRYAGTFEAGPLETLTTRGDDNMADVRGYWNLHGGRLLLQTYRFQQGGYRLVEALLCKRASDDKLDCADSEH